MNINLNINDIADAVTFIDHAADQGAFKGWAMIRHVLANRDRLALFVSAANTQQQLNSQSSELEQAEGHPGFSHDHGAV
jgi:hypothetical protein